MRRSGVGYDDGRFQTPSCISASREIVLKHLREGQKPPTRALAKPIEHAHQLTRFLGDRTGGVPGAFALTLGAPVLILVVDQNSVCGAVEILVLAGAKAPEECRQTQRPETNRARYQNHHDVHQALLCSCSRKAFRVTISEEPDIASAAISGVSRPAAAAGAAIKL